MTKQNPIFKDLQLYLNHIGADRLEVTNPYEIARFKANGETCVIYTNQRGNRRRGSNPLANKILDAFYDKKLINVQKEKRQSLKSKFLKTLLNRDGNCCFYTNKEMTENEMSIEHLIPLSKGGKNNIDNLVLCIEEENQKMADKPLIEKINYKISNLNKKQNDITNTKKTTSKS